MSLKSAAKTTSNYYYDFPLISNLTVDDRFESFPVDTGLRDVHGNYILKIPSAQRQIGFLTEHETEKDIYVSAK